MEAADRLAAALEPGGGLGPDELAGSLDLLLRWAVLRVCEGNMQARASARVREKGAPREGRAR